MTSSSPACPYCGNIASRRVVFTHADERVDASADAGIAFLPASFAERSRADRLCSACDRRFHSDPAERDRDAARERSRPPRPDAMGRLDDLVFGSAPAGEPPPRRED